MVLVDQTHGLVREVGLEHVDGVHIGRGGLCLILGHDSNGCRELRTQRREAHASLAYCSNLASCFSAARAQTLGLAKGDVITAMEREGGREGMEGRHTEVFRSITLYFFLIEIIILLGCKKRQYKVID